MEVPSYKAPKGTEYNPDLGVPSGGPTINQPDIAGPIAGLTKEISRMVIDYQNQKTNTAAKLQKDTIKQHAEFNLKQLHESFKDRVDSGEYSGIDKSGKLKDPNNAVLDFEKDADKLIAKFIKNNNNTPLGKQAILENQHLLTFMKGEGKNVLQDRAIKEVRKNAISTYKINYKSNFKIEVQDAVDLDNLKTIGVIQQKRLLDIRYALSAEDYELEVANIKKDLYSRSFRLQAGSNDPNVILNHLINGKLVDNFSHNDEYFNKVGAILDTVGGDEGLLSPESAAELEALRDRYENGDFKEGSISLSDERRLNEIKAMKLEVDIYNDAITAQSKEFKRTAYEDVRDILEPLRGSVDAKKITEAVAEAYKIANNAPDLDSQKAARNMVSSFFNKGSSNQQAEAYYTGLANIGALTKEFLDDLNLAQSNGLLTSDVANRILGLQNKNVQQYKDIDKDNLKLGLKYIIQKLDPTKVKLVERLTSGKDFSVEEIMLSLGTTITPQTMQAVKLYQQLLVESDASGLSTHQIIGDKKFEITQTINGVNKVSKVNALDYVLDMVKNSATQEGITGYNFNVKDDPITLDIVESGTIFKEINEETIRVELVDVLASQEQLDISKRRSVSKELPNGDIVMVKEPIDERNERIAFYKNIRRASMDGTYNQADLMKIGSLLGFDIRKEVKTIDNTKPIETNVTVEPPTPPPVKNNIKQLSKDKRYNPVTQEFE